MTQPSPSTAQFQLVYYGTPENEGSVRASDLASVLIGMSSLIDAANAVVGRGRALPSLNVRRIRSGSIEIQFAIDLLQVSVNLAFTAQDLMQVLFGRASGTGGLIAMFKLLRGRRPERVTDQDSQTVRIDSMDGTSFLGRRVELDLYQDPEVRRGVQLIVGPLVEFHLDRLVIGDSNGNLAEVTRDEAYQWGAAESEKRQQDMVEAIRQELQTGFARVNERIERDIVSWVVLSKMIGQMQERLDEIEKKLPQENEADS